ncbi:MAG: hypothetical protein H7039_23245 [Bryobacteraceae bacterium]|nr:hypothetical protein [Bryobacteraceae bacterium]
MLDDALTSADSSFVFRFAYRGFSWHSQAVAFIKVLRLSFVNWSQW